MSAVVLTGATGRAGSAIARALLSRGHRVALIDRVAIGAELSAHPQALALGGIDLADAVALANAVADARTRFGTIDALVHTVGAWAPDDRTGVEAMMEANFHAAVRVCGAVVPAMSAGRVILFGSTAALRGRAGQAAYAASKGALARWADALGEELAPRAIAVTTLHPSAIGTQDGAVSPDELGALVSFLVSPESSALRSGGLVVGAS